MEDINHDQDYDDNDEGGFGIVLSDTLISLFAIVMALLVLIAMLPHSKEAKTSQNDIGRLCVELTWPDRNIDLDLWGHSPGDPNTVGYTNMHGKTLNLLKDVVGYSGNPTHTMLEIQCADQVTAGEWIFNVHYFANHEDFAGAPADDPRMAVEATVVLRIKGSSQDQTKGGVYSTQLMKKFTFTHVKQEVTMLRFVLDDQGKIIETTDKYHPLKRGWVE